MIQDNIKYNIGLLYNIGSTVFYKYNNYLGKGLELKGKVIAYWKTKEEKGYIVNFKLFNGNLHLLEKDIYTKSNSIKKL